MDKYISKNQIKVILDNAPKGIDQEALLRKFDSNGYVIQGYNDQDKVAQDQKIQQEGAKANEFLAKPLNEQIFSNETASQVLPAVGSIAKDVLIDTPVKVAKSVASIIPTIGTGGKVTIPGTYQSEAKQTASDVIEGKKPLTSALTPFLTVPLDVTSTVGLGAGAKSVAGSVMAKRQAGQAVKSAAKVDEIVGKIIQGTPEDIAGAKKALGQIDVKGIKTYKDLYNTLDERIKLVSNKLDDTLEQTPVRNELLRLGDMEKAVTVGKQTVRQNYVEDALNQLKDFYTKTNNLEKKTAIEQLITKGNTEGLSVKELNDIAKLHGQDLSGFNANGELASGLSKQAAENTRKGLKSTAREIYGGDAYAQADSELSNLINTRDLVQKVSEKVNQLKQRVTERGLGEKAGRLVFQITDKLTGGGLKGFIQSFIPRGQGLKVMNALDLEKALSKNLRAIDSALNQKTEQGVINSLNNILKDINSIPNKQGGFIKVPAPKSTDLINEAKKYKSAEEFHSSIVKEPLEAGIDRKNLTAAYKIPNSDYYVLAKKTGGTFDETIPIVDSSGKEISSRINKSPEIEYRIAKFDKENDPNLYNAYLRAKTGTTKLSDIQSQLTDIWKKANSKANKK